DNVNLGFSYASARKHDLRFLLTANGFLRAQNNLIFLNAAAFPRNINADDVESRGVEGSLNVWFRDAFRLNLNATRLNQVYGEVRSLSQAESLEGTDFPNIPKWFYNARLTYTNDRLLGPANVLSAYTQYKYVDQFNFLNVAGTFDPASFVPVQKRVDVGINITLQDGKYGLSFNANNILDAEVFDNFSVPRPGRNFNFRLSYRIDDFSPNNQ
ncbi:MAG: TonB-dependent receptor, partial [Bacteroidota bacterium]